MTTNHSEEKRRYLSKRERDLCKAAGRFEIQSVFFEGFFSCYGFLEFWKEIFVLLGVG